ncbi:MAG: DUF4363 family protein [Ruminococcaceae bacterium]|nr:DUF4363 family protein [Oscillospiraceae bacterium]HHV32034.1 DUF4363 family protein [Clostridiales bacterium]
MKRIWVSGIIFVLLLAMCIFGIINTQKVSSEVEQTIELAKQAAEVGDLKTAYQMSQKAVADWHQKHKILCVYMSHAKLEAIDQTLAALPALVKNEANEQFEGECDRGITQIQYLNESEIPTIQNIF